MHRQHAAANQHHSPLTRKSCQCLQQARLVYSFPASTHASMLLLHVQLAQDTCQQRKGSRSCNGNELCPAEAAMRRLKLGALPGAAEQEPAGVKMRILHKPMHLVRQSSMSCIMPVAPTTVLGLKGPELGTNGIQADITTPGLGRSLNRDIM